MASLFGVGLLVAAKLPAFRAGRWTSFGPSGLPARNRRLYFGAWALIIIAFIPLALRGVKYRPMGAAALLRRNLRLYGFGGIIIPFIGIKLIDVLITHVGLA